MSPASGRSQAMAPRFSGSLMHPVRPSVNNTNNATTTDILIFFINKHRLCFFVVSPRYPKSLNPYSTGLLRRQLHDDRLLLLARKNPKDSAGKVVGKSELFLKQRVAVYRCLIQPDHEAVDLAFSGARFVIGGFGDVIRVVLDCIIV